MYRKVQRYDDATMTSVWESHLLARNLFELLDDMSKLRLNRPRMLLSSVGHIWGAGRLINPAPVLTNGPNWSVTSVYYHTVGPNIAQADD